MKPGGGGGRGVRWPYQTMLPVSIEEYRAELHRTADLLTEEATRVGLRGDAAASFVFAENERGSVEIYRDEDHWWLEFWRPEGEEAFAGKSVAKWEMAIEAARNFLQTGKVAAQQPA